MALITWRGVATGVVNYFTIRRVTDNQYSIVAGATFEALTVANWANYITNMTESPGSSYFYSATFPINPAAGWYYLDIFRRATGSPAISDALVGTLYGYWDGTKFEPAGGDIKQVLGVAGNKVDLVDAPNGTAVTAIQLGLSKPTTAQTITTPAAVTASLASIQAVLPPTAAAGAINGLPINGTLNAYTMEALYNISAAIKTINDNLNTIITPV
jgi:hypothetical protein